MSDEFLILKKAVIDQKIYFNRNRVYVPEQIENYLLQHTALNAMGLPDDYDTKVRTDAELLEIVDGLDISNNAKRTVRMEFKGSPSYQEKLKCIRRKIVVNKLMADAGRIIGRSWYDFKEGRTQKDFFDTHSNTIKIVFGITDDDISELKKFMLHPKRLEAGDKFRKELDRLKKAKGIEEKYPTDITETGLNAWLDINSGTTSQQTLIKIAIGFNLTPEEATKLFSLAGSSFEDDRDLIVLSYITVCHKNGRVCDHYELKMLLDDMMKSYPYPYRDIYNRVGESQIHKKHKSRKDAT